MVQACKLHSPSPSQFGGCSAFSVVLTFSRQVSLLTLCSTPPECVRTRFPSVCRVHHPPARVCVCVCVCVCKRQRQRQRQRERDAVLGPPPQLACSGLLLTSLAKGRTAHPAALWGAPSLSPPGGCRAASPLQSSPCLSAFLDSSSSHT